MDHLKIRTYFYLRTPSHPRRILVIFKYHLIFRLYSSFPIKRVFYSLVFLKTLFTFQRGERREKETETSECACLLHTPHQGCSSQPRHVPCMGIQRRPFDSQAGTQPLSHTNQGCFFFLNNSPKFMLYSWCYICIVLSLRFPPSRSTLTPDTDICNRQDRFLSTVTLSGFV